MGSRALTVTHFSGDSYAVAQRFWEFSGVFAAPVRLTIALVFLYKCVYFCFLYIRKVLTRWGPEFLVGALLLVLRS